MCNSFNSTYDSDWRNRIKNFDSVFEVSANPEQAPPPTPAVADENLDLASETQNARVLPQSSGEAPPHMTQDEFKEKYPEVTATTSLNMGGNSIVCHYIDSGKVFLTSPTKVFVAGVDASSPKPLFTYAGGSWISDSSKAASCKQYQNGFGIMFAFVC